MERNEVGECHTMHFWSIWEISFGKKIIFGYLDGDKQSILEMLSLFYFISQFLELKDSLVAGNPFVGQWPVFLCNIFHSWFNSRGFLSPWIKTVPFVWTEYEIPSQLLLKSELVRFEKWHAIVLSVNVGDFFQTTFHPCFNWRAFEVLNTCGEKNVMFYLGAVKDVLLFILNWSLILDIMSSQLMIVST